MKNLYLFPNTAREIDTAYNPYKDDLCNHLKSYFNVVNLNNPTNKGVFDIIKYLNRIDIIYLNWIENLPDKKFGRVQSLVFLGLLLFLKIFKIKIVWTMHNKFSHNNKGYLFKKLLMRVLIRRSDLLITHSSEGERYAIEEYGRKGKNLFIHHPIKDRRNDEIYSKKYDILIWGNLLPYKDIDKFLEFLYEEGVQDKYKVLILGKATNIEYGNKLKAYANDFITVEDRFVEFDELKMLCKQASYVLFTYHNSTVLSSGVLIDSLSYGATVIGPNTAAFADLEKEGIVKTFETYKDILLILDDEGDNDQALINDHSLSDFIKQNSWEKVTQLISDNIITS